MDTIHDRKVAVPNPRPKAAWILMKRLDYDSVGISDLTVRS
jgi:hypothetical protein